MLATAALLLNQLSKNAVPFPYDKGELISSLQDEKGPEVTSKLEKNCFSFKSEF